MSRVGTQTFFSIAAALLVGCAETPKQPVMRPIPPPPPGPPPGAAVVVYGAPQPVTNVPVQPAPPNVAISTNAQGSSNYEVTSNFVANAQREVAAVQPGQVVQGQQGTPQYEIVPPRPGPNYLWRDGFWRWEGASWAWVPGQWEYRPPAVIFVEPEFGYHYHYYGGPRHYRYRRW